MTRPVLPRPSAPVRPIPHALIKEPAIQLVIMKGSAPDFGVR